MFGYYVIFSIPLYLVSFFVSIFVVDVNDFGLGV